VKDERGQYGGEDVQFRNSRLLLPAVLMICGIGIALLSGLVENTSGSIIGATSYGYPWTWRSEVVHQTAEVVYRFYNLAADIAFWAIACFSILAVSERIVLSRSEGVFYRKKLILILTLLIPLGLLMGLIHEAGHAFCGMALGGTLSRMQVAWFTLYPNLGIAPQFKLGKVIVTGLSTPIQQGSFLLAGSLATNIAAWLIAIPTNTANLGTRTGFTLRTLGVIGLLDLPLYTFLPLLGLRHWILLGNNQPEPLIGAREMGIPDLLFFPLVIALTVALILVYSETTREALLRKVRRATEKGI
jgi:hypothetical protein